MKLTPIRKDPKSNSGDCPALYRVEDGGHVVVGKVTKLDAAELAFGLGVDEVAVYVPPGVLVEG